MDSVISAKGSSINVAQIPEEFKLQERWILWKYIKKPNQEKLAKIPFSIREIQAKSNDSSTWSTLELVLEAFKAGDYDGIGFMLSDSDYVGIDIDACVKHNTINNYGSYFVEQLREHAYIEYSPSNTGIHLIVKAKSENAGSRFYKAEIYTPDSHRYFTITGRIISTPSILPDATEILEKVYKETGEEYAVFQRALKTRKGKAQSKGHAPIFTQLFEGDTSGFENDHSKADFALAEIMVEATDGDITVADRLFRKSELMRDKWDTPHNSNGETYGEMTLNKAMENLPGKIKSRIALNMAFRPTDVGNAKRLVFHWGKNIKYDGVSKKWYFWNESHWKEDTYGFIYRAARDTVAAMFIDAQALNKDSERAALITHASKSESAGKLADMIELARYEEDIPVQTTDFDRDAWLFNCENCTINLHDYPEHISIMQHRKEDLITKISPVKYDPAATCPFWIESLMLFMNGKKHLVEYLQRLAGYVLTGDTSVKELYILYGFGNNGKTTFLETLRELLGDYAVKVPTDTLLAKRDSGIPNDVARLNNIRYAYSSEGEADRRLAVAKIKDLTGGDTVSARFMRGEFFDFVPRFKLFMGTNHKPIIKEHDGGIWNRVRMIPFTVNIDPMKAIPKRIVQQRLHEELSGILNWALEGMREWRDNGIQTPPEILEATNEYRKNMDSLADFFDMYIIRDAAAKIPVIEVYQKYIEYCRTVKEIPMGKIEFNERLQLDRGLDKQRGTGNKLVWLGIKFNPEATSAGVISNGTNGHVLNNNLVNLEKLEEIS